jgi:cell division GTPase FtsZ
MRIVALGLGGAGCRIVDSLYSIDRRGSRIACVEGLAVDVDEATLMQLSGLPDSLKLYYPPFDPMNPDTPHQGGGTATIDIAEIISRIHNFESGENDAILICCGLGGQMTDIVPHIIAGLRSTIVEPIFGLVTLPCLAEGEKRSAKAADDIDVLSSHLDGMIVFDNETWYKKIRPAAQARLAKKEKGLTQMLGLSKPEPELSPEMMTYLLLNEAIVRRISLILKAGEFRADGGIDLAEVVLDSGEVLNTMKDGGFITIGYAVEHLTSNPLAFLSQLKPSGPFNEEGKKRASRIVELAKQAIYHEISTPCDMTSAHKALILIAGPSHELSMQGFMTVRKWIDRSIRGLETRSGDYPIMSTQNVAIIVMLSGLENIPRISALKEIREQLRLGPMRKVVSDSEGLVATPAWEHPESLRDEMIVLPSRPQAGAENPWPERSTPRQTTASVATGAADETSGGRYEPARPRAREPSPAQSTGARPLPPPPAQQVPKREPQTGLKTVSGPPGISGHQREIPRERDITAKRPMAQQPISHNMPGETAQSSEGATPPTQEHARQQIERELQRQRMMALSGKPAESADKEIPPLPPGVTRQRRVVVSQTPPAHQEPPQRPPQEGILQANAKKTVIIRKRTPDPDVRQPPVSPPVSSTQDDLSEEPEDRGAFFEPSREIVNPPPSNKSSVDVNDHEFRVKDSVFSGKTVTGTSVPKARDDSLMHTHLKPKSPAWQAEKNDETSREDHGKKAKKKDDISWI